MRTKCHPLFKSKNLYHVYDFDTTRMGNSRSFGFLLPPTASIYVRSATDQNTHYFLAHDRYGNIRDLCRAV